MTNTPDNQMERSRCPTCGSDDPTEYYVDGFRCPDPFHDQPRSPSPDHPEKERCRDCGKLRDEEGVPAICAAWHRPPSPHTEQSEGDPRIEIAREFGFVRGERDQARARIESLERAIREHRTQWRLVDDAVGLRAQEANDRLYAVLADQGEEKR